MAWPDVNFISIFGIVMSYLIEIFVKTKEFSIALFLLLYSIFSICSQRKGSRKKALFLSGPTTKALTLTLPPYL